MSKRRVIFMGTPAFAVPVLDALIASHHDVIAVYTQPPRPAGRGYDVKKSSVHDRADAVGIPVFTPKSVKSEDAHKELAALNADVFVVAGYGLLLPKTVLDTPKFGCINVHTSLLPRWRGAAPVQYAIWKGDTESGVTIMKMDVGMDTGDIIAQKTVPITSTTTSGDLYKTLFTLGGSIVPDILDTIETIKATQQDNTRATPAPMLQKSDSKIDWSQSATQIDQQIRAFTPWPGTYTTSNGKRLKILAATATAGNGTPGKILNRAGHIACGSDALQLLQVQPDGGKPMSAEAAINGNILKIGDVLV